jgi:hypothetical protein
MTRHDLSATTAQPSTTSAASPVAAPATAPSPGSRVTTAPAPRSAGPASTTLTSGPCYTDDDGAMSTRPLHDDAPGRGGSA